MRRGAGQSIVGAISGRIIWPIDPDPASLLIDDIANALSFQCRFHGNVLRFYSTSEHAVHVSHAVPRCDALWGLLHDGHEFLVGELSRTIKLVLPDHAALSKLTMGRVARAFGLHGDTPPASVIEADQRIVADEQAAVQRVVTTTAQPLGITIHGWPPDVARLRFLERFAEIAGPGPRGAG